MAAGNFPACLSAVLRHEGGFVDHPKDPGGATNKGITIGALSDWLGRRATKQEVRDIPDRVVAEIYRARYWDAVQGDAWPGGMDLVAFDGGVNSGPRQGVKWLQEALAVAADGVAGPQTIGAAEKTANGVKVIQNACARRLGFMQRITHRKTGARLWDTFGRGWSRRVAEVEAQAVALYTRSRGAVLVQAAQAETSEKRATTGATVTVGGGGAQAIVADWSGQVTLAVAAVLALVAVALVLKARRSADRAAAYRAVADGLG